MMDLNELFGTEDLVDKVKTLAFSMGFTPAGRLEAIKEIRLLCEAIAERTPDEPPASEPA